MSRIAVACVVYVVDADAAARQGLARVVDAHGLEARPCESADAFIRQAGGDRRACVLIDVVNVLRCGPATRSRLRAIAQTIPIIALSASDDPATRRTARELGAQAFFQGAVLTRRRQGAYRRERQGDVPTSQRGRSSQSTHSTGWALR